MTSTAQLRQTLRLQRQSLSQTCQKKHAQLAQQHFTQFLKKFLQNAPKKTLNIAFFLAQDGELETQQTIEFIWESTPHKLFLPALNANKNCPMSFVPYTQQSLMTPNTFGILEPSLPQALHQSGEAMDIVLMPLVGFDLMGNRMGMGGGYYDRTFAFKQQSSKIPHNRNFQPKLIGWAHHCQHVETLPVEPWDIPLDGIITETELINFSPPL